MVGCGGLGLLDSVRLVCMLCQCASNSLMLGSSTEAST